MTVLRIEPVPGTALAEDKDAARAIREESLLPALAAGGGVILDFSQVQSATQSFVHALIARSIQEYGEAALSHIEFRNCTKEVREIVLTVVDYSIAAFDAGQESQEIE